MQRCGETLNGWSKTSQAIIWKTFIQTHLILFFYENATPSKIKIKIHVMENRVLHNIYLNKKIWRRGISTKNSGTQTCKMLPFTLYSLAVNAEPWEASWIMHLCRRSRFSGILACPSKAGLSLTDDCPNTNFFTPVQVETRNPNKKHK